MSDFGDKLSSLCSAEMIAARGNAERTGEMVERLINSLAFTIAIAGRGDPAAMDTLLKGAEAYLYESATGHAKIAKFMASVPARRA